MFRSYFFFSSASDQDSIYSEGSDKGNKKDFEKEVICITDLYQYIILANCEMLDDADTLVQRDKGMNI